MVKKRRERKPFPTSTTLGDALLVAYLDEKKLHTELEEQIREQEMHEIMDAIQEGKPYRRGRDASPQLNKMRNMLKSKGTVVKRLRQPLPHIRRF